MTLTRTIKSTRTGIWEIQLLMGKPPKTYSEENIALSDEVNVEELHTKILTLLKPYSKIRKEDQSSDGRWDEGDWKIIIQMKCNSFHHPDYELRESIVLSNGTDNQKLFGQLLNLLKEYSKKEEN